MKKTSSIVALLVLVLIGALVYLQRNQGSAIVGLGNQALESEPVESKAEHVKGPDADQVVGTLIENEKRIREVNPQLSQLNRMVLNLKIANGNATEVFSSTVRIRDILQLNRNEPRAIDVNCGELKPIRMEGHSGVWDQLVKEIDYFEHAKFYAIKVLENGAGSSNVLTSVGFEAVGYSVFDTWISIKTNGAIEWEQVNGQWKIGQWDFSQFEVSETEHKLFDIATRACLSPADFELASLSSHRQKFLEAIQKGKGAFGNSRYQTYFRHIPVGQHPSVCVVDINRDGWDDFYMIEQWRKNLLFVNNGDSTFREAASEYQLDIEGMGTAGVFADFDNDGDQDLFLGRSLERSMYLENDNGKFEDRSKTRFGFELPFLVSSLSAADINGDGLLDLYVSTYGFPSGRADAEQWTKEFLERSKQEEVMRRFKHPDHSRYLNATGPPNMMLLNAGDHFEVSKANATLELYSNTLQSTWADYDSDGDPDLYVSNDFAQDFLFRNEGNELFSDVTFEVGDETMMGFGMGATWGDFDLDRRQDLYVSNMYSKAGLRIVEHFGQLKQDFRRSADGNRLYLNKESSFELVSANEGAGLEVNKAGWSWGGQFVDINNDGFLDIYVSSGYFSAPAIFASDKDL